MYRVFYQFTRIWTLYENMWKQNLLKLFSLICFCSLWLGVYSVMVPSVNTITFELTDLNKTVTIQSYKNYTGVESQAMCSIHCFHEFKCVSMEYHSIRNECFLYDRNLQEETNFNIDMDMRSFVVRIGSPNLARNKLTYSSSVMSGRTSSQVVDGDTRPQDFGSSFQCFQTDYEDFYPWLIIDLEEEYFVQFIVVYNAADYPERLHDVNYEMYQENPSLNSSAVPNCCASVPYFTLGRNIIRCNQGVSGRFLKISIEKSHLLTLCEVEVHGMKATVNDCCGPACDLKKNTCYKLPVGENIALNKPAEQTSQYLSNVASYGTDGLFPTYFLTCTGTDHGDTTPYWQVDLQSQYNITSVTIANRVDGKQIVGHRLSDVTIATYTEDPLNGGTPTVCRFLPGEFGCTTRTFECDQVTVGRWLRISKPTEYLTLCEVQVTGNQI